MRQMPRRSNLYKYFLNLLLVLLYVGAASAYAADAKYLVYVGTYTDKGAKGIYAYSFDPASGNVAPLGLAAESENPSFLATTSNGKYLYAVNEVDKLNGQPTGGVSAFAIDPRTGKLTFLNQVASHGAAPAHVSLDKTGRYVLVANYNGGNIAVFPIESDGKLGRQSAFQQQAGSSVNTERQEGPHAHAILTSSDNHFVLSADLGADKIFVYHFSAKNGSLSPNDPAFVALPPGSGPRHFAFGTSGKFLYLANELTGTVTVFSYNPQSGVLTSKQSVSALPENFHGENTEAEIVVDSGGKFLYVSNRGDQTNNLTVFGISATEGTLTFVQRVSSGGKAPRNFVIDPTGRWLLAANQDSNNIQVFQVDQQSGRLSPASQVSGIVAPVCVIFVPAK